MSLTLWARRVWRDTRAFRQGSPGMDELGFMESNAHAFLLPCCWRRWTGKWSVLAAVKWIGGRSFCLKIGTIPGPGVPHRPG